MCERTDPDHPHVLKHTGQGKGASAANRKSRITPILIGFGVVRKTVYAVAERLLSVSLISTSNDISGSGAAVDACCG